MVELNKRGVIYVSEKCQLSCKFCVLKNQINKKPNSSISDLRIAILSLKEKYKLDYVDLAGAEPTLNPDLKEILEYCNEIELKPAIVTNGQLTKVIEKILPFLDDLVLSLHNVGNAYEEATQVQGSWRNLRNTLKMLKNKNFKFRINCHVYLTNLTNLKNIVDLAAKYGAKIIDFIGFCGDEFENETVATYTQSAFAIKQAIDYAKKYPDLIVNVRWIPLCVMKGYESYVIDWHQWIYDQYSWNEASGNNFDLLSEEDYKKWIKFKTSLNYKKKECSACRNREICDGINIHYFARFLDKEFEPIEGELINDAMFYRRER